MSTMGSGAELFMSSLRKESLRPPVNVGQGEPAHDEIFAGAQIQLFSCCRKILTAQLVNQAIHVLRTEVFKLDFLRIDKIIKIGVR